MEQSMDAFTEYQILHQVEKPLISAHKKPLDFSPFIRKLDALEPALLERLDVLVFGKSIAEIQQMRRNGALTYVQLTLYHLDRIRRYDSMLNAFISLNPDALRIAQSCDERYTGEDGDLFGIPIALKDNIATGDRMANTAGSALLTDFFPVAEAPVARRLRHAGAVLLGKTNLSEWAFYMSTRGVCGWSATGGQCRNPHGPYGVGGSSSGSAVAVAAQLCVAAIGSETCGSITNPAGQNGVFGLVPTRGAWPNEGIVPIASALDTAGPIARCVEDISLIHACVTGTRENVVVQEPIWIGVVDDEGIRAHARPDDMTIIARIQRDLETAGMPCVRIRIDPSAYRVDMEPILDAAFAPDAEAYLRRGGASVTNLADVLERCREDSTLAPYGYDIIERAVACGRSLRDAEEEVDEIAKICGKALDDALERVDALLTIGSVFSPVYAAAGYPSLSVPAGCRGSGEPVGATFTARKGNEALLARIGAGLAAVRHCPVPDLRKWNRNAL